MHFQRKEFVDKTREKTVRKYIVLIVVLTMCPAVYLMPVVQKRKMTGKNFSKTKSLTSARKDGHVENPKSKKEFI